MIESDDDNSVYLVDTSILHLIMSNDSVLEKVKNHANKKRITFILLQRVMSEFLNMEKREQIRNSSTFSTNKAKKLNQNYTNLVQ